MLLIPMVLGIIVLTSCGDDDSPAPADPTLALNTAASDANRDQEVSFTGTITAPGGFAALTANIQGVSVSGLTAGETGEQNFTATYTVPSNAEIGSQISIELQATDLLEQTSSTATYTITVVSLGAPTITITGAASADLKRRMTGSAVLSITAPDGLNQLVVTDGDGNAVETVASTSITDPSNYTYEFTVPDAATVGGTYVLNFNATDLLGVSTTTAAQFTTNVLAFDAPTLAFKGFENEADTVFNEGSNQTIMFTVSKDALVDFGELSIAKVVNDGAPTVSTVNVSTEDTEISYAFAVPEVFLDEVTYTFFLDDEFDVATDQITFDADILTTDGAAYVIDDFTVNATDVKRVRGTIDEDVTLMAANDYYLPASVRVDDDATLTIEAGTTIYAESGQEVELRVDGTIDAQGTSMNPIVMTSGAGIEGGTQEPGDWVGLRINGAEGVNSGTLRYIRVEYGGTDNAGVRLQDVDALTTVEYIQVFKGSDDEAGFEVRGGTVNLKYIVVTDAGNISLNFRAGENDYSGNLQFILLNSPSITEKDGRDFEFRRDESTLTISNLTMLGAGSALPSMDSDGVNAIRIDDGTNYKIYNSVIAEYSNDGIRIDYQTETPDYGDNTISNSYIFQIGDQPTRTDFDDAVTGDPTPLIFETDAGTYSNTIDAANTPAAAAGIGVNDFIPDALITSSFDPTTLGMDFSAGTFVGAFDGSNDWTAGWTLNADGSAR